MNVSPIITRREGFNRYRLVKGHLESMSPTSTFKKSKPLSPFVSKLRLLLKDGRYHSAIHWSKDGKAIVVTNPDIFKALVLDNIDEMFKTRNFTSFVRQLNLYGFRKIPTIGRSDPMKNMHFEHPHFCRDRPESMHLVHRTCISSKKKCPEVSPDPTSSGIRSLNCSMDSNSLDLSFGDDHMRQDLQLKDEVVDMSDESTSQDHDYALPTRNDNEDQNCIDQFDAQQTFEYLDRIFKTEKVAVQGLLQLYCNSLSNVTC